MPIRSTVMAPSTLTKTLLCIDETDNGEVGGTIFNPYMKNKYNFRSVIELLQIMEKFFDDVAYPQAEYESRTFMESKAPKRTRMFVPEAIKLYQPEDGFDENGRIATFVVNIHLRKNATWQGKVSWREREKSYDFRSVMELLRLIDSAITQQQGSPVCGKWA